MKVNEFAPGNGWYTKIPAPLLNDKGQQYLVYRDEWLNQMDILLALEPMKKTKKLSIDLDWNNKEHQYQLGDIDFAMNDADMLLNIREYPNFDTLDTLDKPN
jgi:predicted methyltransferase